MHKVTVLAEKIFGYETELEPEIVLNLNKSNWCKSKPQCSY